MKVKEKLKALLAESDAVFAAGKPKTEDRVIDKEARGKAHALAGEIESLTRMCDAGLGDMELPEAEKTEEKPKRKSIFGKGKE
jgi:hypothetical protein